MGIAFTISCQPHTKPLYLSASFHSCRAPPPQSSTAPLPPCSHIPVTLCLRLQGETVQQGFRVSPIPSQRASLHFLHAGHQTECLPWAPDIHVATSLMTIWAKVLWGIRADVNRYGRKTSSRLSHHGDKSNADLFVYLPKSWAWIYWVFILCPPVAHKSGKTQESTVALLERFEGSASEQTRNAHEGRHGSRTSCFLSGCSGKSQCHSIQKDIVMDTSVSR